MSPGTRNRALLSSGLYQMRTSVRRGPGHPSQAVFFARALRVTFWEWLCRMDAA